MNKGLAVRIARELRSSSSGAPPVDLSWIASHRGAAVRLARLEEDGRLFFEHGRPVIELRADRPRQRQRFTLAHEIAHLFLAQELGETGIRRRRSFDHADEETLCDWIAAALLMPDEWMNSYRSSRSSLQNLRTVAKLADVSLSAAAVRLAETTANLWALLRWRVRDESWTLAGMAGVPSEFVTRILMPAVSARRLRLPSPHDEWLNLSLLWGGVEVRCRVNVNRGYESCLMLVTRMDR